MFKLVAILYALTNGVASEQPSGSFTNNRNFQTREACVEYLQDDQGAPARQFIEDMAADNAMTVKFDCISEGEGI